MGTYIYRVTAQRVMCSDGKEANVAKYAYKPYYYGDGATKLNNRMDFQTGCPASRKLAREGRLTDRITMGDGRVFGNPYNWGTFSDDGNLGTRMPLLDVTCSEVTA